MQVATSTQPQGTGPIPESFADWSEPQTIDAMERELTTLAGHLNAANYRFLKVLAEFDRVEGYVGIGIASCAHWLSWRCGIGRQAAREKVRVAKALRNLPRVSDAMRRGVISYCKVRALTRIATPETEDTLLLIAEAGTVSHVERTVQLFRKVQRVEELEASNRQHCDRYLQCSVDEQGCVVVKGRLPPEQGAAFMKVLQATADMLYEQNASRESGAPDAPVDEHGARRADALVLMAETFAAHGASPLSGGDRHLVTVHVDERVLHDAAQDGRAEIAEVAPIPPATIRRLCCDGSLIPIIEDEQGTPLSVGRKTRAVPPAIRRALDCRDAGCRFPGCTNTRFVDAHHIQHWADGGETSLENLVLLCRRHHRFVHEHGYTITRVGSDLHFKRPDGRPAVPVPPITPIEASAGYDQLQNDHEELDLDIDYDTGDSHWRGDSLDYRWVIRSLFDKTPSPVKPAPDPAIPQPAPTKPVRDLATSVPCRRFRARPTRLVQSALFGSPRRARRFMLLHCRLRRHSRRNALMREERAPCAPSRAAA